MDVDDVKIKEYTCPVTCEKRMGLQLLQKSVVVGVVEFDKQKSVNLLQSMSEFIVKWDVKS